MSERERESGGLGFPSCCCHGAARKINLLCEPWDVPGAAPAQLRGAGAAGPQPSCAQANSLRFQPGLGTLATLGTYPALTWG